MDVKSTRKSNNSTVSFGISMDSDADTSSSIEDNISKIIGHKPEGKLDRIDTIFLQPEIRKLQPKVKKGFEPLKPLITLKNKFVTKSAVKTNSQHLKTKTTLLSEELSMRAENTNRINHEYRKFIDRSMFVTPSKENQSDVNSKVNHENNNENNNENENENNEFLMDVEEVFDLALANYFKCHYNIISNKDKRDNDLKESKLFEVLLSPNTPRDNGKNFVDDFGCLSELINVKEDKPTPRYILTAPPRSVQRPTIKEKKNLK